MSENQVSTPVDDSQPPEVQGTVSIDYDVQCPHCNRLWFSDLDAEQWETMFGDDTKMGEDYDVTCAECGKEFHVTEFVY